MPANSRKAVYAALGGNLAIALIKGIAAWIGGSAAMQTEALHSLVDCANELLLMVGMARAAKPPDQTHPFGYGLEIYFWSFAVAVLVFSLGGGLALYEGALHIAHPARLENSWIGFAVLLAAACFEGFSFRTAWTEFSKVRRDTPFLTAIVRSKDPALFSVLLEDGAALIGLGLAILGLGAATGLHWRWADGAASVMIGLLLIGVAGFMAREIRSLMSGEAAAPHTIKAVRALLEREPAVEKVQEVLTMHLGPAAILMAITLDYQDAMPIAEVEAATERLSKKIRDIDPRITRIFVRSSRSRQAAGAA
jgi:cation diffusion facilitator family transporter